jgi:hypothetical protein
MAQYILYKDYYILKYLNSQIIPFTPLMISTNLKH